MGSQPIHNFSLSSYSRYVFPSALAIFIVIYLLLEPQTGYYSAAIFSLLPALAAGYALGMKKGILATALIVIPLTNLLNYFIAGISLTTIYSSIDNVTGIIFIIVIAAVIGRMFDLQRQAQNELAHREIIENELRIANDQLQRSADKIQLVNSELETLLYVVSHDLKEPLRGINTFSHLIETHYADKLDEKGQDYSRRLQKASARLNKLLDDLLILSRVRRQELDKEIISGEEIVNEAVERLSNAIQESEADIQIISPLPDLYINRIWTVEAVYNLINNAVKFSLDGKKPEITIKGYHKEKINGLCVQDRGIGVRPEHANRIFKLFQRAVNREIEGVGTGLAIVQHVAERHGGRAWVESREGGGSSFCITFAKASDEL